MKTQSKVLFLLLTLALLCAIPFVTVYAEDAEDSAPLSKPETAKYPLSSNETSRSSAIEYSSADGGYRTYAAEFATVVYKDRNGNELSRANYVLGDSLTPPDYEGGYRDDAEAFKLVNWTAEIDGRKYAEFSEITAMMLGKTVIMTPNYEKATFMAETAEETTYNTTTAYSDFLSSVTTLPTAAKITLFSDFADSDIDGDLTLSKEGTELDLNGHTLAINYKLKNIQSFIHATETAYIYSSVPGAQLIATTENVSYLLQADAKMVVGRDKDGTTYDKGNLTIKGTSLLLHQASNETVSFDSITYINTCSKNGGIIVYSGSSVKEHRVDIQNCDFWLTDPQSILLDSKRGRKDSATITDSFLYVAADRLAKLRSGLTGQYPGATITDTVICSSATLIATEDFPIYIGKGVLMNQECDGFSVTDDYVLVHTDTQSIARDRQDFTLLYEVVPKGDAVKVTFVGDGATLSTQNCKSGSTPTEYRKEAFDSESTYVWRAEPDAPVTKDTVYEAKLVSTEPKITGNLALYANISIRLYFEADGFIKGVRYNGKETTFSDIVSLNGSGAYYFFEISDIAPKDLSDAFTLEVLLEKDGKTATYTVNTSLSKYAAAVLKNTATDAKTEAGKALVLALLDYVREMSVSLGDKVISDEGIRAIDTGLRQYGYVRKAWNETATVPKAGNIVGAALHLESDPGFVFFLSKEYAEKDKIAVGVNGVNKEYTVTHTDKGHYFIVDSIHISNYIQGVAIALDGQEFTYDLGAYMMGFRGDIPDYANALYTYSLAAKAYLEVRVDE